MNVKCRMQSAECRRSIAVWLCILHSAFCIAAARFEAHALLRLTYRILGASGDLLLLEPVSVEAR